MPNRYQFEVILRDNAGNPVSSHVPLAWANFLNGHWTKTVPTRRGRYVVARRTGRVSGEAFIYGSDENTAVVYRDSAMHPHKEGWDGWWWSVPTPPVMPLKPPVWVDDVGSVPNFSGLEVTRPSESRPGRCHLRLLADPE